MGGRAVQAGEDVVAAASDVHGSTDGAAALGNNCFDGDVAGEGQAHGTGEIDLVG